MAETPEQKAKREAAKKQAVPPMGGTPPSAPPVSAEPGVGVSPETVAQLMAMIKMQGEQIQALKQMQMEWKDQYDRDMAQGLQLAPVSYEDVRARQEEEARRLALEISRETHSAANTLKKKIKHKLASGTWDFIAPALVAAYRNGKAKGTPEDLQTIKDELKKIVVDPRFRIQSTTWLDIERALDGQVQTGTAALSV